MLWLNTICSIDVFHAYKIGYMQKWKKGGKSINDIEVIGSDLLLLSLTWYLVPFEWVVSWNIEFIQNYKFKV